MSQATFDMIAGLDPSDFLSDAALSEKYLTDWRGKWTGRAIAVARPRSTEAVQKIVSYCHDQKIPIVPQGGNTSLSGAATPDASGKALVLSLERLNEIESIDPASGIITAGAGCTLLQVQEAAAEQDRLFPLSFASEGTCQIGGALSTNAGGTHVFRYGSARNLCLGLEVVLPNGEVLGATKSLFKDNTGYDLRDLFIGAEGTLGIITKATLKTYPSVKAATALLVAVQSVSQACRTFRHAQSFLGPGLTACEMISDICLEHVLNHTPNARFPLEARAPYYVLLEVSSWESDAACLERAMAWFETVMEGGVVMDATISESISQFRELWALRENISESQSFKRPIVKHDISLPLGNIPDFIDASQKALQAEFGDISIEPFGHLGDGNLHYNIGPGPSADFEAFNSLHDPINTVVHDLVDQMGGSISAEHGLGVLRRDEAERYRSPIETLVMRQIKQTLDPHGLMNPGKVLSIAS